MWGIRAVVQRRRGKCPDSAGGGGGGRVTGVSDITSRPSPFSTPLPPPLSFADVPQEPSNTHGHVRGILRRHGDTSEGTHPQNAWTERSATKSDRPTHAFALKRVEKVSPHLSILSGGARLVVHTEVTWRVLGGGGKGAKVTSRNRSTNSNLAHSADLGEAIHIA